MINKIIVEEIWTLCNHDQMPSIQAAFAKDVRSLASAFHDLDNPFEEEGKDFLVLDTKEISKQSSVEVVRNIQKIGQEKCQAFIKK